MAWVITTQAALEGHELKRQKGKKAKHGDRMLGRKIYLPMGKNTICVFTAFCDLCGGLPWL